SKIPPEEKDRLLNVLSSELYRIWRSGAANDLILRALDSDRKISVAIGAQDDTKQAMPTSLLQSVIAKAKACTGERGQRSELARRLGVPRQRVAQWFSGVSAPNAEDALKLADWVKAAAAETNKEPSGAETPEGLKTRNSKSTSNEKAKSNRRKR
ncbi:MAG: helix-turn-helix transcriptional regulator, partial [Chthoniobacteraceae bacterium]